MKILLSIDDTDNFDSIGTGELLEILIGELAAANLATCSFVTRHQLYIHPDIAYTSHNSAMCCEGNTDKLMEMIAFCRNYMDTRCAEGSDPGLCVLLPEQLDAPDPILSYGKAAKISVLTKADAYALSERYTGTIFLSEHGGTGDGIIGALAGCGLRLSGNDGRVKRNLKPNLPNEILTIEEFCQKYQVDRVADIEQHVIAPNEQLIFRGPSKAMYSDFQKTVYVAKSSEDNGLWCPLSKKELREIWKD